MSPDGHLTNHSRHMALPQSCSKTPASHSGVRHLWRNIRALRLGDIRVELQVAKEKLLLENTEPIGSCYGDLCAIQAVALALEDDTLSATAAANQALRAGASCSFRRLADLADRFCAWKAGTAPTLRQDSTLVALEAAGTMRRTRPSEMLADVLDLTLAAAIGFSRLQVVEAELLARCALLRSGASAASAAPASVLARILYEQGKVDEAEQVITERLSAIQTVGALDCRGYAYYVRARAAALRGDCEAAHLILEEACEVAAAKNWPRLLAGSLAERIRLCEPGDEKCAASWLEQLRNLAEQQSLPAAHCARSEITNYLHRAQIYHFLKLRSGAPPRAAVAHLHHDALLSQDRYLLTWVTVAQAQILWLAGDASTGLECLQHALRTAQTSSLRQQLLDAGPPLPTMLERLLEAVNGMDPDVLAFTICLAESFNHCRRAVQNKRQRRRTSGAHSLTKSEQSVLQHIAEGRTNKMIAQIQGITPETVKTHVKHIFAKLGVARRAEAVVKGDRLGLLTRLPIR